MDHRRYSIKASLVVHRELRKRFPENAGQRCMYGAFALAHLLREMDFEATVVGGDFAIFVPARDGRSAAFHGFGGSNEPGTASHYWVESCGRVVDASTLFLHTTTDQDIVRLPVIYWPISQELPRYLRYSAIMRADKGAEFSTVLEQREKAAAVVDGCLRRLSGRALPSKQEVLDGPKYVFRTKAENAWSKAAVEYETNTSYGSPPI